jgi:hypothetical protein
MRARKLPVPLPSWRKKFLVKTKQFAAFARLKNKKSAEEVRHGNNKSKSKDTTNNSNGVSLGQKISALEKNRVKIFSFISQQQRPTSQNYFLKLFNFTLAPQQKTLPAGRVFLLFLFFASFAARTFSFFEMSNQ